MLEQARRLLVVLTDILTLQQLSIEEFKKMSDAGEKVKADLSTAAANVAEISGDFQELLDKIAAFNGLPTPDEFAEIQAAAAALKASTRAAADIVPEPPVV